MMDFLNLCPQSCQNQNTKTKERKLGDEIRQEEQTKKRSIRCAK